MTLERLRDAHAEGRLDADEFYGRLDAVYNARTYADLDALVIDLPLAGLSRFPPPQRQAVLPPTPTDSTPAPRATAAGVSLLAAMPPALRGIWITWATAVMINIIVWTAVSLGNGSAEYPWPIWVAGPWGIINLGITANWWFGRGDELRKIGP